MNELKIKMQIYNSIKIQIFVLPIALKHRKFGKNDEKNVILKIKLYS